MIIKEHLCGYFVAYQERGTVKRSETPKPGREQGSHYSQQKRRIADAVRYIQLQSRPECKPLIFVATTPGFLDHANEPKFISRLVDNLKKGYHMENYIWVREYTKLGYPHFHFVANIPLSSKIHKIGKVRVPFDPKKLSFTWSSYFGQSALNSIRVGSKPCPGRKRKLYLSNDQRQAWYLSKYIGKSRGEEEKASARKIMAFRMDNTTSKSIEPMLYYSEYTTRPVKVEVWDTKLKKMVTQDCHVGTGERIFKSETGQIIDPHGIDWNRVEGHEVYTGFRKNA